MMVEAHGPMEKHTQSRLGLRVLLASGPAAVPLARIHQVVGFAALAGPSDEYFLGWLALHGEWVPVFDLNRVICEEPTPAEYGSRIILVHAAAGSPTRYVGLLAAGVTDTVELGELEELNLNLYLPMIYSMIPSVAGG